MIYCKMCNKSVPENWGGGRCMNCGHIFSDEEKKDIIQYDEHPDGFYSYSDFGDSAEEYSNYND